MSEKAAEQKKMNWDKFEPDNTTTSRLKFSILDHGYLELCDSWGSDEAVIRAARMSTDKGFLGFGPQCIDCIDPNAGSQKLLDPQPADRTCAKCGAGGLMYNGDEKLLRYLWENQHSTPFEFGGLTIEVQAPIAVFREWHRHRVPFGYSELSARYTPMPDVNYVPTVERIVEGSKQTKNRQASSVAGECTEEEAELWLEALGHAYRIAEEVYQQGLKVGVPKELARGAVTVFRYSRMRATGNLRGWLNFCRLRCAPQAQWEIRQFANAVGELLGEKFPRTWELYQDDERKRAEEKTAVKKLEAITNTVKQWHEEGDFPPYTRQLLELLGSAK